MLHYGQYKREQLFALQETPDSRPGLASGLVVGVCTGAPFIQDGISGVFVDRLPPGAKCIKNDADEAALAAYMQSVQTLQNKDRKDVREQAALAFHPVPLVNGLVGNQGQASGMPPSTQGSQTI